MSENNSLSLAAVAICLGIIQLTMVVERPLFIAIKHICKELLSGRRLVWLLAGIIGVALAFMICLPNLALLCLLTQIRPSG